MKFPRNARIFRGQWDAVPFVSVFFLLALFMALESRMAFVPGVAIELPEGGSPPAQAGPTLMVAMDRAGQLYYDNQAITPEVFKERLREDVVKLGSPVTLIVHADKAVPNEHTVRLCGLAKAAGVREVVLATRVSPLARPKGIQ